MMINSSKIYKMRVVFHLLKQGWQQPQTVRALRQMILKSGLVFAPVDDRPSLPRFAYGPALPVGVRARREYVDVYLDSWETPAQVKEKLQQAANGILEILQVFRVPYRFPSVQQLATVALYKISGPSVEREQESIEKCLHDSDLPVVFRAPNGMTFSENAKAYIVSAEKTAAQEWQIGLRSIDGKWLNPYALLAAILGMEVPLEERWMLEGFTIERQGLYWQDSQGRTHLI